MNLKGREEPKTHIHLLPTTTELLDTPNPLHQLYWGTITNLC